MPKKEYAKIVSIDISMESIKTNESGIRPLIIGV